MKHAPGRNDPCPCGSKLKYKKCCELKKNQPKKFSAEVLPPNTTSSLEKIGSLSSRLHNKPTFDPPENQGNP